jgi:hypothetical protein
MRAGYRRLLRWITFTAGVTLLLVGLTGYLAKVSREKIYPEFLPRLVSALGGAEEPEDRCTDDLCPGEGMPGGPHEAVHADGAGTECGATGSPAPAAGEERGPGNHGGPVSSEPHVPPPSPGAVVPGDPPWEPDVPEPGVPGPDAPTGVPEPEAPGEPEPEAPGSGEDDLQLTLPEPPPYERRPDPGLGPPSSAPPGRVECGDKPDTCEPWAQRLAV